MEKLFWSTQVPVFNYITKYYKNIDKPGFLKKMYDSFQKNIDNIKNMDPAKKAIIGHAIYNLATAAASIYLMNGSTLFMKHLGLIGAGANLQHVIPFIFNPDSVLNRDNPYTLLNQLKKLKK